MGNFTPEEFLNPKRARASSVGRSGWYPYYAGFSAEFAGAILEQYNSTRNLRVLDSWNGSGTTTASAAGRGFESFGYDLNPAMAVVARARLLNKRERSCLMPLSKMILCAGAGLYDADTNRDPLCTWFKPNTTTAIRIVEASFQKTLLGTSTWKPFETHLAQREFSDLAAFFYVALFRTVRGLLSAFQGSNPTWMKLPATPADRISVTSSKIKSIFLEHIRDMEQALDEDPLEKDGKSHIGISSSSRIPIQSNSIDVVITSPPYCTRIDYAAATRIELAVLGVGEGGAYECLRRSLMGTPTVPKEPQSWKPEWGDECRTFLDAVKNHPSRASGSYYHKGHCQYFSGLQESIAELSRCLKAGGKAYFVVQDSYYKELHINLAKICKEMSENADLELKQQQDYPQKRNLAQVNPKSKSYRTRTDAIESVLVFSK